MSGANIDNNNTNVAQGFEAHADNNMRPTVFSSARKSELALRAKYNFPAPMYSFEYNAISDDEDLIAGDTGSDTGDEDNEYDVSHYDATENTLIRTFSKFLYRKANALITSGFLEHEYFDDPSSNIILSQKAFDILSYETIDSRREDFTTASYALDLSAAINALNKYGSHSHNGHMKQTRIVGYGMRNLVALLWHCCLEANKHTIRGFMPGVTQNDAINALVHGIAEGARGGNRNKNDNSEGDDLGYKDLRVCDQGRYNSLFAAFLGIFPEVNIIYDYSDCLLIHLKQKLLTALVKYPAVGNMETATQYITYWNNGTNEEDNQDFINFVAQMQQDFPSMLQEFINTFFDPIDDEMRTAVNLDINKHIAEIEAANLETSYIESVSINATDLQAAWEKEMVASSSKRMKLQA